MKSENKITKTLNLVIVDRVEPLKTEAYVHSFSLQGDIKQPEKALRNAVKEFITSGTEECRAALNFANGYYNWGDAMSTVPDSIFEKHGLVRLNQDAVDIIVNHDEVLCGDALDEAEEDCDTFSIYQLKLGDNQRNIRFIGYDQLIAQGNKVEAKNYSHVYTGVLADEVTLDDLYHKFNVARPADFKGHSLSTSDVVVLRRSSSATAYYVDGPFGGFRELAAFNWKDEFWPDGLPDVPVCPKDTL